MGSRAVERLPPAADGGYRNGLGGRDKLTDVFALRLTHDQMVALERRAAATGLTAGGLLRNLLSEALLRGL